MRHEVITCDVCRNECTGTEDHAIAVARAIISLLDTKNTLNLAEYNEHDFCSIDCLRDYVKERIGKNKKRVDK